MAEIHPSELRHYAYQGRRVRLCSKEEIDRDFKAKERWYIKFLGSSFEQLPRTAPILDVPCGHGNFSYFLKNKGFSNYIGVDIDNDRVALGREFGLNIQLEDAFEAINARRNLAVIASLDFFEHVEKERVPELIKHCLAALDSGGTLIIRMPVTDSILGPFDLNNDYTHKWSANSGVMIDLLLQEGFSKVNFKDERPVTYKFSNYPRLWLFYVAVAFINLIFRLLGFPPFKVWSRSGWFFAVK